MADLAYNIHVLGRHVQVTEAMKNYAIEKLEKLDRFHPDIIDVHVTMDIQKVRHMVDISMKFGHFHIKVHGESSDMYASIDQAMHKLQNKIRRWKSKIQDHHSKKLSVVDMQVNVLQRPYDDEHEEHEEIEEINAAIEEQERRKEEALYRPPEVIGSETYPLKLLRLDEAVMKLELSGDHFILFRDETDQALKVVYRRTDGNYALLCPL